MSSPASPADMRAYIIERLVGETGEPDRVVEAALHDLEEDEREHRIAELGRVEVRAEADHDAA